MQFDIAQLTIAPGSKIFLNDVDWAQFEQFLSAMGDRCLHLAYNNGILKLMSPSVEHEYDKKLLATLVECMLDALDIEFECLGSVTLKHAVRGKGVEPDECYYIHNSKNILGLHQIDLRVTPPPDLVLEVDISSKTNLAVYQAMGVPEVWFYAKTGLTIYKLEDNDYIPAETSIYFPIMDLRERLTHYVELSKTVGRRAVMRDFRVWLTQTLPKLQEIVDSTNRVASQAELMRLFQCSGMFHYDVIPVANTSINDLNMGAIDAFFSSYNIEFSQEDATTRTTLLINTDILAPTGVPTVGGLLMFGINPLRYLPQAGIMFAHFNGHEIDGTLIDRQEIGGTLPQQVDTALAAIKHNVLNPSIIVGLKREDTSIKIPDKVLREIIVNACVHRNYAISGSRIRIFMFSDRVEFISPGRLPNTVTIDKLRSGVSYASNPVLVKFMDNLRYMDRIGQGFPMVYREMQRLNKPISVYELGEELRVVLYLCN